MNSSAEVWIWLCCVYEYRNRRMCQSRRIFPLVKVEEEIVLHLMVEDETVLHLMVEDVIVLHLIEDEIVHHPMIEDEIVHHPMIEDETVLPIIIEDTNFIHWLIVVMFSTKQRMQTNKILKRKS